VITSEAASENAYTQIKREFGGKQDITTQFVIFDDALLDTTKAHYTYLNILLGIYVKSGLQPWILNEAMHSDCYVGLDVSHENKRHASGIIQIVGKDGRLLKQKSMSDNEAGEIISWETMKDIIMETVHAYKTTYGEVPAHITFHRDGLCREDLDQMQHLLSSMNIRFDYVEIIKNTNRRMATHANKQWYTEQGLAYIKANSGYLCATSPKEFVGMAQPIKVVQKTTEKPFNEIIEDVYHLSFMHVHSMLKTRLPITIHYADLSSTFHNRGMINGNTRHERSLPFV
jgi:argonaute-like protein implicated in RNA metabolism and viral defense